MTAHREDQDMTNELQTVARFDAGDPAITLDQYDEAIEALAEAGLA